MPPNPLSLPTPRPKTDPPSVRWLRRPARLALLRVAGAWLSQARAASPQTERPRVLFIRPDHLGDLLCLTPALKFLRAQWPHAHLTALVGSWGSFVLENNPHIDALQTLSFPGFTRRPKTSLFAPYRELQNAAQSLRAQRFDAAVILRSDHWWGAWLAALARIPRRIGYDIAEVKPFITESVCFTHGRHEVQQNLRLMARLADTLEPDATPQTHPLEFPMSEADAAAAQTLLQTRGVGAGERFAILQPGSGAAVKLWRADGFARVAEVLRARWGLRVVVVGGADEGALIEQISAHTHTPLANLVGQTTLPQLAALFARATIAIGTDSGPMHLAVATRTPSVHLFGPVSARAFGPWGDPMRHVVLTANLPCIPCNRLDYTADELAAHPCVRLIGEQRVVSAIEEILSG